jgi:TPR repeat protein
LLHYVQALDWRKGLSGPPDRNRAFQAIATAVDHGFLFALNLMGTQHELGEGIPVQLERAKEIYAQGIGLGIHASKYNLALLLWRRAHAVSPADRDLLTESVAAYEVAVGPGASPPALLNLSVYLVQGQVCKRDPTRSVKLIQHALALGHDDAAFNMGLRYMSGVGLPLDRDRARQMFKRALRSNVQALLRVLMIEEEMSGVSDPSRVAAALTKLGGVSRSRMPRSRSYEVEEILGPCPL